MSAAGEAWLSEQRQRVEETLASIIDGLTSPDCPERLRRAMRYSLEGGGKRLRPLLCLAALRAAGGTHPRAVEAACSLELLHTYSLIHDDLPAMDDDELRRGRPTCHRAFDEGLAILAGDGLLTLAFEVLARAAGPELAGEATLLLSAAAGPAGLVGGQADDLTPMTQAPTIAEVESIHRRKTGALMRAALGLGGLLAHAPESSRIALQKFGEALGLAFQIADDCLAESGDARTLGKDPRTDRERGRRTHPLAAGLEDSRRRGEELLAEAEAALAQLPGLTDALSSILAKVKKRLRP
ncbi:MAG: polyprenyl synthetase family protein [Myxococcales bacterium]|nr:polyprenyl synthetase family protein [Myxococcales bacterium]